MAIPVLAAIFYVACGGGDGPDLPPCISVSDCPADNRCINNICFPPGVDAGLIDYDAGPSEMDAGDAEDAGVPPGDDAGVPPGDDAGMSMDAATSGSAP